MTAWLLDRLAKLIPGPDEQVAIRRSPELRALTASGVTILRPDLAVMPGRGGTAGGVDSPVLAVAILTRATLVEDLTASLMACRAVPGLVDVLWIRPPELAGGCGGTAASTGSRCALRRARAWCAGVRRVKPRGSLAMPLRTLLGALVVIAAAGGVAAEGRDAAGAVSAIRGAAEARSEAGRRPLAAAAPVYLDEAVSTGRAARLTLALGERTMLRLGERAEVRLVEYLVNAGGVIELASGAVLFERFGPPAGEAISIESPYGLIAVRGTRFFAGPSNGVFGVFVEKGAVAVTGGGATVTVTPGFGTDIAAPGAEPGEPARWGRARIDAALSALR